MLYIDCVLKICIHNFTHNIEANVLSILFLMSFGWHKKTCNFLLFLLVDFFGLILSIEAGLLWFSFADLIKILINFLKIFDPCESIYIFVN